MGKTTNKELRHIGDLESDIRNPCRNVCLELEWLRNVRCAVELGQHVFRLARRIRVSPRERQVRALDAGMVRRDCHAARRGSVR